MSPFPLPIPILVSAVTGAFRGSAAILEKLPDDNTHELHELLIESLHEGSKYVNDTYYHFIVLGEGLFDQDFMDGNDETKETLAHSALVIQSTINRLRGKLAARSTQAYLEAYKTSERTRKAVICALEGLFEKVFPRSRPPKPGKERPHADDFVIYQCHTDRATERDCGHDAARTSQDTSESKWDQKCIEAQQHATGTLSESRMYPHVQPGFEEKEDNNESSGMRGRAFVQESGQCQSRSRSRSGTRLYRKCDDALDSIASHDACNISEEVVTSDGDTIVHLPVSSLV